VERCIGTGPFRIETAVGTAGAHIARVRGTVIITVFWVEHAHALAIRADVIYGTRVTIIARIGVVHVHAAGCRIARVVRARILIITIQRWAAYTRAV